MSRWLAALALMVGLSAIAAPSRAAPPDPPPIEAYGHLPAISHVSLSPSGERLAFVAADGEGRKLFVRTVGGRYRIHVELVGAKSRFQIWSGTFTSAGDAILSGDPATANEIAGQMKAQVCAGNWKIQVHAFRNTDIDEIGEVRFAAGAQPLTNSELIGFRAKPDFRTAELDGLQQLDVTQTTYPSEWRELPVFEWKTDAEVTTNFSASIPCAGA